MQFSRRIMNLNLPPKKSSICYGLSYRSVQFDIVCAWLDGAVLVTR